MMKIIEGRWAIKRGALGNYFVSASESGDLECKGFSESRISDMLKSKTTQKKINSFKALLQKTFQYDFIEDSPIKGYEVHHISIRNHIKTFESLRAESILEVKPDKEMAQSFEGVYLGIAKPVSNGSKIVSFLMQVSSNAEIEIASRNYHYRKGVLASSNLTIYFFLNSVRKEQPELYITSIPRSFKNDTVMVEKFDMCGTWINTVGRPAYGACFLANLKAHSLGELEIPTSLKNIANNFFDKLESSPEFIDISKSLIESKNRIHYLTKESNVDFKPVR